MTPCTQEDRINKIENNNSVLTERIDNLIKKMDRWANVTIGLIVTIVAGMISTVLGGIVLALLLYVIGI